MQPPGIPPNEGEPEWNAKQHAGIGAIVSRPWHGPLAAGRFLIDPERQPVLPVDPAYQRRPDKKMD